MNEQQLSEIEARRAALPEGPWQSGWDGQQFYVRDSNGEEIIEYTFAIPTWGERYEQARATCDIAVPTFLAHAPDDVAALTAAVRRLNTLVSTLSRALSRYQDEEVPAGHD